MDHTGCTQLSIRIASPVELESEGDRIFAAHAEWIARTHHRSGDRALLQYLVAKRPARDGVVVFHLTEIYQPPGSRTTWSRRSGGTRSMPGTPGSTGVR